MVTREVQVALGRGREIAGKTQGAGRIGRGLHDIDRDRGQRVVKLRTGHDVQVELSGRGVPHEACLYVRPHLHGIGRFHDRGVTGLLGLVQGIKQPQGREGLLRKATGCSLGIAHDKRQVLVQKVLQTRDLQIQSSLRRQHQFELRQGNVLEGQPLGRSLLGEEVVGRDIEIRARLAVFGFGFKTFFQVSAGTVFQTNGHAKRLGVISSRIGHGQTNPGSTVHHQLVLGGHDSGTHGLE